MRSTLARFGYVCVLLLAGCQAYNSKLLNPLRDEDAGGSSGCSHNRELCNGLDDDCDGVIDEAVDDCQLDHAAASCVSGHCAIVSCDPGFSNCNDVVDDGCEFAESDASCHVCGQSCDEDGMDAGAPALPDAAEITTLPNDGDARLPIDAATHPAPIDGGPTCSPQAERCDGLDNDCDGKIDEQGVCDGGTTCHPQAEECDGVDNDCDDKIDEQGVCDSCVALHVSGQSSECDRCVCSQCAPQVDACVGNPDWNERCVAILQCYGANNLNGKCPGGDCYGNGGGPCASKIFAAGPDCTSVPPNSGCSAATSVRTKCLLTTCASVCKF